MDRENSGVQVVVAVIGATGVVLSAVIGTLGLIISTAIAAAPHPVPTPPTRGDDAPAIQVAPKQQPTPPPSPVPAAPPQRTDMAEVTKKEEESACELESLLERWNARQALPPIAPTARPTAFNPVAPVVLPPAAPSVLNPTAPVATPPAAQPPAPPAASATPPTPAFQVQGDDPINTPQSATLVTASGKMVRGVLLEVTKNTVRFQFSSQVGSSQVHGGYRFDRAEVKRIVTLNSEYIHDTAEDRFVRQ